MLKLTTDKQTDRQTDRQTNKQTGQKQYAPDHSIRGHKKNQGVFVKTLTIPPAATKSEKAIFRAKVKVKVTTSLTLVSFERASLVEYAY